MVTNHYSDGLYSKYVDCRGKDLICKMNEVNVIHSTACK